MVQPYNTCTSLSHLCIYSRHSLSNPYVVQQYNNFTSLSHLCFLPPAARLSTPFILGPIPMFFNHTTLVLACPNQHWHWPTPPVHFYTVQPDLAFCCSTIQYMYWPVLPVHLFIVWPDQYLCCSTLQHCAASLSFMSFNYILAYPTYACPQSIASPSLMVFDPTIVALACCSCVILQHMAWPRLST